MKNTINKNLKTLSIEESLKIQGGIIDAWEWEFDKKELDSKAKYLQVKQSNQFQITVKK